jgi:hypothetical protein
MNTQKHIKSILAAVILFGVTSVHAWAQESYQGWGCSCYGAQGGIQIEECANSTIFGGVRVQARPIPPPNGCGEEGGKKFPDTILGVSIRHCCDQHDNEYGTCGFPKDAADTNLGRCGVEACQNAGWHNKLFSRCQIAARGYQVAVELRGTGAYRATQSTLCQCSPCGASAAFLCFYDGSIYPGPIQWPPWEPGPIGGGGF